MKSLLTMTGCWFLLCVSAFAQSNAPLLWRAKQIQHAPPAETNPYFGWIIVPCEGGKTNGASFRTTIDAIYRAEAAPIIKHVCLGAAHRTGALQEEVIRQLKDTVVIQKYPTRHDANGWMWLGGTETPNRLTQTMYQLVHTAILNTTVVREMDEALSAHGLRITNVSMEKLYIASEKGKFRWDAIAWLIIGKAEQSAATGAANATPVER
ncbi:MAG: hypothetical protein FJ222_08890 [Lentisphaerae bacterium]|nr:hypothetical protein [Lentisphaerota bacterium]